MPFKKYADKLAKIGILEVLGLDKMLANEFLKEDILNKIKQIASETGDAPGQTRFASLTGIKDHVWRGKFWRGWSDALIEAGYPPKEWVGGYDDDYLLNHVSGLAKRIGYFPLKVDLQMEAANNPEFPSVTAIRKRWNMRELAEVLAKHCNEINEPDVAVFAKEYADKPAPTHKRGPIEQLATDALGFVYLQQYGSDYKIGFTNSLNKRGRQIQIELPQEVILVHSILTDDPAGVEAYWHKRFAAKRTRGEWFKLTKSDVALFKRWTKIW